MAIYLHATEPPSGRPTRSPLTAERLYNACYRGEIPAEALTLAGPGLLHRLIYDLWLKRWTDVEIGIHTKTTTYTVARIRQHLELAAHQRKEAAA